MRNWAIFSVKPGRRPYQEYYESKCSQMLDLECCEVVRMYRDESSLSRISIGRPMQKLRSPGPSIPELMVDDTPTIRDTAQLSEISGYSTCHTQKFVHVGLVSLPSGAFLSGLLIIGVNQGHARNRLK